MRRLLDSGVGINHRPPRVLREVLVLATSGRRLVPRHEAPKGRSSGVSYSSVSRGVSDSAAVECCGFRGAHPVAAANAVLSTRCERLSGSARGPASL
jgi:hypothetical protein